MNLQIKKKGGGRLNKTVILQGSNDNMNQAFLNVEISLFCEEGTMHLIFSPPLSLVPVLDAAPGWASWRCSRTSPGRPLPTCPCQGLGVPRGFMGHPCQGCHVGGKELCPRREARGHPKPPYPLLLAPLAVPCLAVRSAARGR